MTYRSIADALKERIDGGDLAVGQYLPTERELQEEFSVSRTTIRRALAALADLGIAENIPNRGVVVTRPANPGRASLGSPMTAFIDGSTLVLRALYRHMSSAMRDSGVQLVHIDSELIGTEPSLQFALDKGFQGAFIWPFDGFVDSDYVKRLTDQLPTVVLDHQLRDVETDLVTFDYFSMAQEATAWLTSQGCQRIAVTGMLDMLEITHQRFAGYMKAMFDARITIYPRDFAFCYTSEAPEQDFSHLKTILSSSDRPDAVFVMQDTYLPGAVQTAVDLGLRVPEDVKFSTIGNDVAVSVDGSLVPAIHCDWHQFGEIASEMLTARIADPSRPPKKVFAPHHLSVAHPDQKSWAAQTVSSPVQVQELRFIQPPFRSAPASSSSRKPEASPVNSIERT